MLSNKHLDQATQSADLAIKSTQRVANETLDGIAGGVQNLHDQAAPMINRAADQVSAFAHRSADSVRDGTQQLRDGAHHASEYTSNYIKNEPVKAMLIAAATGAALMALISLMRHRN
jgi:ElaB/YqjD/DUF883 family membrane-anchored ribosome-binding protein